MKKVLPYGVGVICTALIALGLVLLVAPKTVAVTAATVIICLSIAYGLLTIDPGSIIGLAAGVCMIVFPGWIVGIFFAVLGVAGTVANLFVHKR